MQLLRSLRNSPGFSLVAVCTVALGIASSTTIYSVADAVVFRPLPFKDESNLFWVWSTRPDRDRGFFSIANFLDLQRDNQSTAGFAGVTPLGLSITGLGEPERVSGWRVSPGVFSLLGVTPQVGRLPQAADELPGAAPVAMLGHGYWHRRFGGDPQVVGRTVSLNGHPHVIGGVLPRDFCLPGWPSDLVVAAPWESDARRANRGTSFLRGIARLKPGVTLAQARAEFAEINARLVRDYPDDNGTVTAPRLVPLREEITGGYRSSVLLLLAAAGTLLLIMCANLAGLLAARAISRQRDAALCSALGASPGRLLRIYLTEGLVLAGLGGLLGAILCWWGLDALIMLAPADLPRAELVAINFRVLAVAATCTLLTGFGVGLAPAIRLARTAPVDVLKSHGPAGTARTLSRRVLVAAQLGLCTALLIGTGLLVRSLRELLNTNPGFDPRGVLTAQVALTGVNARSVAALNNFADEYQRRLAKLPGVTTASVTSVLPLSGLNTRSEFTRTDRPPANPADSSSAANRYIGADYFTTVGIPLRAGRDLTLHDDANSPGVVLIDEALAKRDWPGENPVGKSIRIKDSPVPRVLEVVGIVGTAKNFSLEESGTPTVYLSARQMPATQLPFLTGRMIFVARTSGDPKALVESARRELRALDGDATVTLRSLEEATAWARAPRIFNLRLLGFFSGAAVLLAVLGLYATTTQSVAARTREFGIRLALGADGARLLRDVFRESGTLVLAGIAAGAGLAAVLSPLLARMLYGVRPFNAATYAAVSVSLAVVALLAVWFPARRATKVDPLTALRSE